MNVIYYYHRDIVLIEVSESVDDLFTESFLLQNKKHPCHDQEVKSCHVISVNNATTILGLDRSLNSIASQIYSMVDSAVISSYKLVWGKGPGSCL